MRRTRVGFLGAGYIARRHVAALSQIEGVAVVGVADPDADRAASLARELPGAVAVSSMPELLDRCDLDAVYICIPPFAHGEPEMLALDRRLPMFVEKPIALDLATARAVADAVTAAGIPTAVGYHWRYLDVVARAQELLRERPVRMVLGHWLTSTPGAAWWTQKARSGGQMLEQATHLVDLGRCLAGEVVDVRGWGSSTPRADFPSSDVFDSSVAVVTFETGALGVIAATCLLRASHRIGLQVIAEGLSIEVLARGAGGTDPFDLVVDTGDGARVETDGSDPFVTENRAFVDAVRGDGDAILVPYAEALRSHEVAFAAATTPSDDAGGEEP